MKSNTAYKVNKKDSNNYKSNPNKMLSRMFFTIEVDHCTYPETRVKETDADKETRHVKIK